ncbi:hypothetical protein JZO83_00640 [Enterococcus sp. DIV1298c]|uniref:pilin N-terminal domain-containing protein n=1 Tax=Enterococcus sp. DIV1298c TaxID=2815328 RepID=UPI001A92E66B|nr:pilin N-terminal domain-containing protein [Enterococcus sp. DIV1298c]MBO0460252.1 hypothetical protein [Enterococcus sp. DIV1298c]
MSNGKNKYSILFISLFVLLFIFNGLTIPVYAEDGNFQLTIVKYKLSAQDIDKDLLPAEPTDKLETDITDESGQALAPFPGIRYRIVKVTPSNNSSDPFTEISGVEPIEITTGTNGQATISLSEGLYEITELANDELASPAEPVVVQLPTITDEGTRLEELFVYPKSSVLVSPVEGIDPPTSPARAGQTSPKRIPQTGGALSSLFPIYLTIALIVLLGIVVIVNFRPKRKKKP